MRKRYKKGTVVNGLEPLNLKVVAIAVESTDGQINIKMQRDKCPVLHSCEKLLFRVTYESNGIPSKAIFGKVGHFMEVILASFKFH